MKNFKFLIIVFLIAFAGGVVGFIGAENSLGLMIYNFFSKIGEFIALNSFLIFMVWAIGSNVLAWGLYFIGKFKVNRDLKNDEEIINDNIIAWSMTINNLIVIVGLVMFVNIFKSVNLGEFSRLEELGPIRVVACIVVFLLSIFVSVFLQKLSIEFIKGYNPDIYANILDLRFQKKYIKSVDEREKLEIYKAGYKAYTNMQRVLFFLVAVLGFIATDSQLSMLSIFLLVIVLAVGIVSYCLAALKK